MLLARCSQALADATRSGRESRYPNCFWGWGFEDHDLLDRLARAGLPIDRAHWPPGNFTHFEARPPPPTARPARPARRVPR